MIIAASFFEELKHVLGSIVNGFLNVAFTGSLLLTIAMVGSIVWYSKRRPVGAVWASVLNTVSGRQSSNAVCAALRAALPSPSGSRGSVGRLTIDAPSSGPEPATPIGNPGARQKTALARV